MKNQGKPQQNTGKSPSKRDQTNSQATKENPEQSGLTRGADPKTKPSAAAPKK